MMRSAVFSGLILLIAACAGSDTGSVSEVADNRPAVTGTVTYRERMLLPPDAEIEVSLLDVSLMDVAAKLISTQTIVPDHAVPIAFVLRYDPQDIDQRMTYAVRATIRSGDRLLFVTDRSYTVLTRGQSSHVDLVLKRVQY
jgi:putative lipoprotein